MIETILAKGTCKALKALYDQQVEMDQILVHKTRKDFDGDYSINVFPFLVAVTILTTLCLRSFDIGICFT